MSGTVFVTMDMDWANDGVLRDTVSLAEKLEIPVTMFVTHDTPMLAELQAHPLFELGIHPNFLPQLNGQSEKTILKTLEEMHALVPDARVIRCHALVDATPVLVSARQLGFEADLNLFIPLSSGISLKPYTHFSGLRRLPFFYEDDAWALEQGHPTPKQHMAADGLKIFNFHPIHLYLNTETMDRYGRAKAYYHDFDRLAPFINRGEGFGARDFLLRIAELGRENGIRFGRISELL